MSQSEDDDYAFFGTPLEQLEEDVIPRKKPITVQDQIATDKHGRRRFHGAFTGGFSAGFFNSVGSLEGWAPSSFKSSRSNKADSKFQKPEDFMDDEDLEEFGIAPTVVRTKPEYSGSSKKRERINFSDGPIPGEPVLKSILEPVRETIGVLLLMKMGWKPGQGIGPKLTRLQKKKEKLKNKVKVYGCSLTGKRSDSEGDDDSLDEIIVNPDVLFAPQEHEVHFMNPKTNTFGMGYTGLQKSSLLQKNATLKSDTFKMCDNNKKLAIKGQAFGVGAFEEEDDDIYAKEDMSQYDFALETASSLRLKRKEERQVSKLLSLTGQDDFIEGFVKAKNPDASKKFFPPPELPADYEPIHSKRKTRFDPQHSVDSLKVAHEKHFITSSERAAIIGESRAANVAKESRSNEKLDECSSDETVEGFRPFIADPEKQKRYEKYLQLAKIGAKDAFSSILPKTMSDWEKQREMSEFEQAARLYKPLSGMMAERFAHGELPDDSADPLSSVPRTLRADDAEMEQAAKSKMFGKLTRKVTDWTPCPVLCKRMNIAEPFSRDGTSMAQVANDKKPSRSKFSIFNFLEVAKENAFQENDDSNKPEKSEDNIDEIKNDTLKEQLKTTNKLLLPTPVIDFEEPVEKKDLFKAIFCSDEEDSDNEEQPEQQPTDKNLENPQPTSPKPQPQLTISNALRNTSPPKGIFANLDLDLLNKRKTVALEISSPEKNLNQEIDKTVEKPIEKIDETNLYGPSLPSKPLFTKKYEKIVESSTNSDSNEEWVERKEEKEKKKRRKHKKCKDKRKKHKSKHKKKEK